jgi:hypothetical protein
MAACSQTQTTSGRNDLPAPNLSAVQEASTWFAAVDSRNLSASLAHFEPQQHFIADWDGGDVSMWPHFERVKCSKIAQPPIGLPTTSTNTTVRCTFHVVPSPGGDNSAINDTFWSVSFHRSKDGPWLIDNYGQP